MLSIRFQEIVDLNKQHTPKTIELRQVLWFQPSNAIGQFGTFEMYAALGGGGILNECTFKRQNIIQQLNKTFP